MSDYDTTISIPSITMAGDTFTLDDTITIDSSTVSPYTITGDSVTDWTSNITTESPYITYNRLSDQISKIEKRLNILEVNKELEDDWEELRRIGDKYRELEATINNKNQMWKKLSDE
jgi:hypothetical protein